MQRSNDHSDTFMMFDPVLSLQSYYVCRGQHSCKINIHEKLGDGGTSSPSSIDTIMNELCIRKTISVFLIGKQIVWCELVEWSSYAALKLGRSTKKEKREHAWYNFSSYKPPGFLCYDPGDQGTKLRSYDVALLVFLLHLAVFVALMSSIFWVLGSGRLSLKMALRIRSDMLDLNKMTDSMGSLLWNRNNVFCIDV